MAGARDKHKGSDPHNPRSGMGRLRRVSRKDANRLGGWERVADDDEAVERLAPERQRASHAGENLLARFNRLAGRLGRQDESGTPGEVSGFAGAQVLVRAEDGSERPCDVRQALLKRFAGVRNPLCVGDRVRVAEEAGSGVVVAVEPRRTQLERVDSHNRSLVHVFAANVDRLIIASSLADPDFKAGLVDRYLVIASASALPATLVLTKTDLASPDAPAALYRSLGVPVFAVTTRPGGGDAEALRSLEALREHLRGLACVIAGQSGVGKSSLVNVLYPTSDARVGSVAVQGFGRHTTTGSRSYLLPGGTRLIDTPGIRECTISGLTAVDVALHYPDLAALAPACRFRDCTHGHEPGCAVVAATDAGSLPVSRYLSYRSIVEEDLQQA